MTNQVDDQFYDRADAHIHLSNDQSQAIGAGKVSASMMYATARFNVWLTASGCESGEEMVGKMGERIDFFVREYRIMLEEHFEEYIENFEDYMLKPRQTKQETPE